MIIFLTYNKVTKSTHGDETVNVSKAQANF